MNWQESVASFRVWRSRKQDIPTQIQEEGRSCKAFDDYRDIKYIKKPFGYPRELILYPRTASFAALATRNLDLLLRLWIKTRACRPLLDRK
jgi:hypothetical protein